MPKPKSIVRTCWRATFQAKYLKRKIPKAATKRADYLTEHGGSAANFDSQGEAIKRLNQLCPAMGTPAIAWKLHPFKRRIRL